MWQSSIDFYISVLSQLFFYVATWLLGLYHATIVCALVWEWGRAKNVNNGMIPMHCQGCDDKKYKKRFSECERVNNC